MNKLARGGRLGSTNETGDGVLFGCIEAAQSDLIPYIEKTYSVKSDPESRDLAGLSMGGGQSLNIGLNNLDTFAWVGGFSSAPNTKPAGELIQSADEATKMLRLLYVACGDKDGLFRISQGATRC